jgi:hypothetical protein
MVKEKTKPIISHEAKFCKGIEPDCQIQKLFTNEAKGSRRKSVARINTDDTITTDNPDELPRKYFTAIREFAATTNHANDIARGTPFTSG